MTEQVLTWYSAAKLPEVRALGLRSANLQLAVMSGAIKTTTLYRTEFGNVRKYLPVTSFTREDLDQFLASEECATMVRAVRDRIFKERIHKPLQGKAKEAGLRRRLIELRQEASEAGMAFEDYLLATGHTGEEIDVLTAPFRGGAEHPDQPLPHDEEEGEWDDAMDDLSGLGAGFPLHCAE